MEERLTTIVHEKIYNAVRRICDKVEKSYADAIAVNPRAAEAGPSRAKNESKTQDHDIGKSFRIQGVKEDPVKLNQKNLFLPSTYYKRS